MKKKLWLCLLGIAGLPVLAQAQCPAAASIFADPVSAQNLCSGSAAGGTHFTGSTATTFYWSRSGPFFGIPASGMDSLPQVAAFNPGGSNLVNNIQVTPARISAGVSYLPYSNGSYAKLYAIDNASGNTLNEFYLPGHPVAVHVARGTGKVFLATDFGLQVIDTASNLPIRALNNDAGIGGIAYAHGKLYVGKSIGVLLYDTSLAGGPTPLIPTDYPAYQLTASRSGNWLIADHPLQTGYKLSVINTLTNMVTTTIDVPYHNAAPVVAPGDSLLYLACSSANEVRVYRLSDGSLKATYATDLGPNGLDFNSDGSRLYVACGYYTGGHLDILRGSDGSLLSNPALPVGASGVSVSPGGSRVFISVPNYGGLVDFDIPTGAIRNTYMVIGGSYNTNAFSTGGADCFGNTNSYTITVAPARSATIAYPNQPYCSNPGLVTPTLTGTSGGTFSATPAGLALNTSTGAVSLGNSTPGQYQVSYVLPANGFCAATTSVTALAINPPSNLSTPGNIVACNNLQVPATVLSTAVGSTITWTNSNPAIGLSAAGTGDLPPFTATNTGSSPVSATITVNATGGQPSKAYICNLFSSSVAVVNTATGALTKTIPVDPYPLSAWTFHNGTLVAATLPFLQEVQLISTASDTVTATIHTTYQVYAARTSPDDARLYLTGDSKLHIVDVASGQETGTVLLNADPNVTGQLLEISADGKTMYVVTNLGLSVVDLVAGQLVNTLPAISGSDLAISPNGQRLYLVDQGSGRVIVVNTANNLVLTAVQLPAAATYVYPSNDGARVAVARADSSVTLLDGSTLQPQSTIPLGGAAGPLQFSQDGTKLYIYGSSGASGALKEVSVGQQAVTNSTPVGQQGFFFGRFLVPGTTCAGGSASFTITVNPLTVPSQPADRNFCAGSNTGPVVFSGASAGATYQWTNSNPAIGLAASGTGNLPSFTAINNGTSPVSATITVSTGGTAGCANGAVSFQITVNPKPSINNQPNQVLCAGSGSTPATFSSNLPGATFAWTNSNSAIGLPASGTGVVPSFTATNGSTAPLTAIVAAQAQYTANGLTCSSAVSAFQVTVNPDPTVNQPLDVAYCAGSTVPPQSFSSPGSGTTFQWTNSNPAIGLAASGNGGLPSFTATNSGSAPLTATITVTPRVTNGGKTCYGSSKSFIITVNAPQSGGMALAYTGSPYCLNAGVVPVTLNAPAGGSFSAAPAGLSLNSASGAVTTNSSTPGTYAVTYNLPGTNGNCPLTATATVTIKNSATAAVQYPGTPFCPTGNAAPVFTGTGGGTYNASPAGLVLNSATGIVNLGASAAGSYTVTYSVPAGSGCANTTASTPIDVLPSPVTDAVSNRYYCVGTAVPPLSFTSATPGVGFSWTNSTPAIGLPASGMGALPAFNTANSTTAPLNATITARATYANGSNTCLGKPMTFTIRVNPVPTVAPVADQSLCNGSPTGAVVFSGTVAGSHFAWTNDHPGIGVPASGAGSIASFVAQNNTAVPVVANFVVTPSFTSGVKCNGNGTGFSITVLSCQSHPLPDAGESLRRGGTASSLRVGPNPSRGPVTVWTDADGPIGWNLRDGDGRMIATGRSTQSSFSIDLSAYAAGTYTLELRFADGSRAQRLLVRL